MTHQKLKTQSDMQRLTALCKGREYEIEDVASILALYIIWEFVRWEPSNYLEKQTSGELAVMPALSVLMLQIDR